MGRARAKRNKQRNLATQTHSAWLAFVWAQPNWFQYSILAYVLK